MSGKNNSSGTVLEQATAEIKETKEQTPQQAQALLMLHNVRIVTACLGKGAEFKADRTGLALLVAVVSMELTAAGTKAKETDDKAIQGIIRDLAKNREPIDNAADKAFTLATAITSFGEAKYNDAMTGGVTPRQLHTASSRIVMAPKGAALREGAIAVLSAFENA